MIDAGDFCDRIGTAYKDIKDQYFFRGMQMMKYDAVAVGENEIIFGYKKLLAAAEQYRLPITSSNVTYRDSGELFAPKYIIKKIGGKRSLFGRRGSAKVGIFSVMQPVFLYANSKRASKIFKVLEPDVAALETVSRIREQDCDMIIAISHIGWRRSLALAEKLPGVDIIINSHESRREAMYEWVGGTLVVNPGRKQTSFTEITALFEADSLRIEVIERGKEIFELEYDTGMAELEKQYLKETKELRAKRRAKAEPRVKLEGRKRKLK